MAGVLHFMGNRRLACSPQAGCLWRVSDALLALANDLTIKSPQRHDGRRGLIPNGASQRSSCLCGLISASLRSRRVPDRHRAVDRHDAADPAGGSDPRASSQLRGAVPRDHDSEERAVHPEARQPSSAARHGAAQACRRRGGHPSASFPDAEGRAPRALVRGASARRREAQTFGAAHLLQERPSADAPRHGHAHRSAAGALGQNDVSRRAEVHGARPRRGAIQSAVPSVGEALAG